MRKTNKLKRHSLLFSCLLSAFIMTACGDAADATPEPKDKPDQR